MISLLICELLWENQPNCWLLQNEVEAHKVDTVITAVGDQKTFFYKELEILTTFSTFWSNFMECKRKGVSASL